MILRVPLDKYSSEIDPVLPVVGSLLLLYMQFSTCCHLEGKHAGPDESFEYPIGTSYWHNLYILLCCFVLGPFCHQKTDENTNYPYEKPTSCCGKPMIPSEGEGKRKRAGEPRSPGETNQCLPCIGFIGVSVCWGSGNPLLTRKPMRNAKTHTRNQLFALQIR